MQQLKTNNLFQQLLAYNWLLAIVLIGCTPVKYTDTNPDQPKARYYSFSKSKPDLAVSKLDTSVIYVYQDDLVKTYQTGKTEKFYGYIYIAFKDNGVAFYSGYSTQPIDQTNIYSIGGQNCFYKIDGDELQLEFYDFHLKRFAISYGRLMNNGIYFYKKKLRMFNGAKSKTSKTFRRTTIKYEKPLTWPK